SRSVDGSGLLLIARPPTPCGDARKELRLGSNAFHTVIDRRYSFLRAETCEFGLSALEQDRVETFCQVLVDERILAGLLCGDLIERLVQRGVDRDQRVDIRCFL